MTASRKAALAALILPFALILPLGLGGCISLFPKTKPVQMYRFGDQVPPPAAAPAAAPAMVLKGPTAFPPASATDRILTVTGAESAYIGEARWVAPAAVLFDSALLRTFDVPGSPRLVERGEPLAAPSTLRLDVRVFEARYPGPTATVQVRATLIRNADRGLIAEKMFDAKVPAGDNRQTAIVAAFDQAVGQVLSGLRDWTAANAPASPPPVPAPRR
jgi:cholesterol transport system auxiliary component